MKSKIYNIISLNARGLRNKHKRSKLLLWSRQQKCDVLLLQETYWTADMEKVINCEWNGTCFYSNGTNHARGVAVIIANDVSFSVESVIAGFEGRALMINGTLGKCDICIVCGVPHKKKITIYTAAAA